MFVLSKFNDSKCSYVAAQQLPVLLSNMATSATWPEDCYKNFNKDNSLD